MCAIQLAGNIDHRMALLQTETMKQVASSCSLSSEDVLSSNENNASNCVTDNDDEKSVKSDVLRMLAKPPVKCIKLEFTSGNIKKIFPCKFQQYAVLSFIEDLRVTRFFINNYVIFKWHQRDEIYIISDVSDETFNISLAKVREQLSNIPKPYLGMYSEEDFNKGSLKAYNVCPNKDVTSGWGFALGENVMKNNSLLIGTIFPHPYELSLIYQFYEDFPSTRLYLNGYMILKVYHTQCLYIIGRYCTNSYRISFTDLYDQLEKLPFVRRKIERDECGARGELCD